MLESHPAEGEDPKFKGSMLVALAESAAEVRELLSRDIYATEGVWDLENAQIIPVSFFSIWSYIPLLFQLMGMVGRDC